jgi:hypothetical protein
MKRLREIWNELDPEVQVFYQTMGEFFVVFTTIFLGFLLAAYIIISC